MSDIEMDEICERCGEDYGSHIGPKCPGYSGVFCRPKPLKAEQRPTGAIRDDKTVRKLPSLHSVLECNKGPTDIPEKYVSEIYSVIKTLGNFE